MTRYFFDIHDGFHVVDDAGRELPDLEAARVEAMKVAGGFAADPKALGRDGGAIVVTVRDGPDSKVLNVRLVYSVDRLDTSAAPQAKAAGPVGAPV